jgi:hypothetical protein
MGDAPVEVACPELVAVVATAMASSTRDVRSSKCLIHNRCASTQGHNKGPCGRGWGGGSVCRDGMSAVALAKEGGVFAVISVRAVNTLRL